MTSPMIYHAVAFLGSLVLLASSNLNDDNKPDDKPALNAKEKAFAELLTGATLSGHFTMRGQKDSKETERYDIVSAEKVQLDPSQKPYWLINARMKFGKVDVVLPVPVNVVWAYDTPVMSLTSATIPGLGSEFGCRILFYENEYAGTWSHGDKGGHMFGEITHEKKTEK